MKKDRLEPASRVLASELRARIDSHDLAPGDRLPSERALVAEHGVARNTAREAIRLLAEAGLVSAEQGRGVFVRRPANLMRFGQQRYSAKLRRETGLSPFRAEVEAQGQVPRVECTSITRVDAPDDVAERLQLTQDDLSVVRRENWYYADDEPSQVGITWAPWSIVEGTPVSDSANMGIGSLYGRFEDQGYLVDTIREEISARMPTHTERTGLQLADGVPVLDVLHTSVSPEATPFEVTRFVLRTDRNGLDYTMKVDE